VTEILGYRACNHCSEPVPEMTWRAFGGFCIDCSVEAHRGASEPLYVLVDGGITKIDRPSRASKRGPKSKKARKREKLVDKAKIRAMRGLRDRYWAEYIKLLGIERSKLGLDPMPPQMAPYLTKPDPDA
jgi:hypothetical protein